MKGLTLAIDTATTRASVALVGSVPGGCEGVSIERSSIGGNSHHEELATLTHEVLRAVGAEASSLTQIVVGAGPGSFTGLRIGYSFARGVAVGIGIPMFGVSSLAGAVWEFRAESKPLVPVLDAGRGEVFYAVYRPDEKGLAIVCPPSLIHRDDLAPKVQEELGCSEVVYVSVGESGIADFRESDYPASGLVGAFLAEGRSDERAIDREPEYLRAVAAKTIRQRLAEQAPPRVDSM